MVRRQDLASPMRPRARARRGTSARKVHETVVLTGKPAAALRDTAFPSLSGENAYQPHSCSPMRLAGWADCSTSSSVGKLQAAGCLKETQVDDGAALPADQQTSVAVEPRDGALDFPAVLSQLVFGLNARTGDARSDPSATAPSLVQIWSIMAQSSSTHWTLRFV